MAAENRISENESGVMSIDLMIAVVLVFAAAMAAFLIIPTLSHENRDWRIKQYMAATRATDSLVQDAGETGWETEWTQGNYTNVTKIGMRNERYNWSLNNQNEGKAVPSKVLGTKKIEALMGNGYQDYNTSALWWEFPNTTTNETLRQNAAKALGLKGYNFYMQLHPVGMEYPRFLPEFNSTPVLANLSQNLNLTGVNLDAVSVVDRYVYVMNTTDDGYLTAINSLDADKSEYIHYRLSLWVW